MLEDDGERTLVQWGTVNVKSGEGGNVSTPITEWVSTADVSTLEEPVYFGTEAEKNRTMVYDPAEH